MFGYMKEFAEHTDIKVNGYVTAWKVVIYRRFMAVIENSLNEKERVLRLSIHNITSKSLQIDNLQQEGQMLCMVLDIFEHLELPIIIRWSSKHGMRDSDSYSFTDMMDNLGGSEPSGVWSTNNLIARRRNQYLRNYRAGEPRDIKGSSRTDPNRCQNGSCYSFDDSDFIIMNDK